MAKSAKFRIGDRVPIKYYEQNTTAVIVGFVNSYYRVRIEAYKEYRSDKDAHRMKFGTLEGIVSDPTYIPEYPKHVWEGLIHAKI